MDKELEKRIQSYIDNSIPKMMKESGCQKILEDMIFQEILYGYADWRSAIDQAVLKIEKYMKKDLK